MSGSSSKVWKGAGLSTVHSSVFAPSPHGLAGTFSPALSVRQTMKKNSSVEAVVMKAPMDET